MASCHTHHRFWRITVEMLILVSMHLSAIPGLLAISWVARIDQQRNQAFQCRYIILLLWG